MNVLDIKFNDMSGKEKTLNDYKNRAMLVVNTASKCGFTPQFEGLEELYKEYNEKGLEILGFPCNQFLRQDPGSNEEILSFCQVNYGVTFPMLAKIDVKGKNQAPLYEYLTNNSVERQGKKVKWNFEKFLLNENGEIVKRYLSTVKPKDITKDIETLLK